MAYEPYPYIVTETGDAEDAPSVAQPIALYGAGSGDEGVTLPIDGNDVVVTVEGESTDLNATVESLVGGILVAQTDTVEADRVASLPASKITSGTFTVARIPDLSIAKITGLEARLTDIENRLAALEA